MKNKKASKKSTAVTQPKKNHPYGSRNAKYPEVESGEHVPVEIKLPPALLGWATNYAFHLAGNLSDLVRDCLDYERYRDTKEYYSTEPEDAREKEGMRRYMEARAKGVPLSMEPSKDVRVLNYETGVGKKESLTRDGNQYFVNGRKVTVEGAFRWMSRMEKEPDAFGGGDAEEQSRFFAEVAKLLK